MGKAKNARRGQGLVEFALLLPLLLLIIIGIIEFGRVLFIYVNVSNAAREGARHGMVDPKDWADIAAASNERLALIPPVTPAILYDHGPGMGATDKDSVTAGDRVCVGITYVIEPMTPIMQPFMGAGMNFETENCRTIQSTGSTGWTSPGDPLPGVVFTDTPTPTPTATNTPTETPTPTETNTPDPAIDTDTPTPTATPTVMPTLPPINIDKPLEAGETRVTGYAAPGYAVTVRVIQTGLQRTVTVAANGTFTFDGLPAMIEGHTVVVQGYGNQDLAIVQPSSATPTPTATPSTAFIYTNIACIAPGATSIHILGANWPTGSTPKVEDVVFYWDGGTTPVQTTSRDYSVPTVDILLSGISVPNPPPTSHTLVVHGTKKAKPDEIYVNLTITIPVCQSTPTPSPTPDMPPDLVITSLKVTDDPLPGTYDRIHLSVTVLNDSETDVTSLFWVDLFADPDQTADQWWQTEPSVDYVGVNALAGGSSITFTMYVPNGFTTADVPHTLIAMVDTWNQISELHEDNNLSPSQTITLTTANLPPTATPVVTVEAAGGVLGVTYLDEGVQAYVSVYLYDSDGRLWASGRSDDNGDFTFENIAVGEYTVVAQLRMSDELLLKVEMITITAGAYTAVDMHLVSP